MKYNFDYFHRTLLKNLNVNYEQYKNKTELDILVSQLNSEVIYEYNEIDWKPFLWRIVDVDKLKLHIFRTDEYGLELFCARIGWPEVRFKVLCYLQRNMRTLCNDYPILQSEVPNLEKECARLISKIINDPTPTYNHGDFHGMPPVDFYQYMQSSTIFTEPTPSYKWILQKKKERADLNKQHKKNCKQYTPITFITAETILGKSAIVNFDSEVDGEQLYIFNGIGFYEPKTKEEGVSLCTSYIYGGGTHVLCKGLCSVLLNWALLEANNRAISENRATMPLTISDLNFNFDEPILPKELYEKYLKKIMGLYELSLQFSPIGSQYMENKNKLVSKIFFDEYSFYTHFRHMGMCNDFSEKQLYGFSSWWFSFMAYLANNYSIATEISYISKEVFEDIIEAQWIDAPEKAYEELIAEDFQIVVSTHSGEKKSTAAKEDTTDEHVTYSFPWLSPDAKAEDKEAFESRLKEKASSTSRGNVEDLIAFLMVYHHSKLIELPKFASQVFRELESNYGLTITQRSFSEYWPDELKRGKTSK